MTKATSMCCLRPCTLLLTDDAKLDRVPVNLGQVPDLSRRMDRESMDMAGMTLQPAHTERRSWLTSVAGTTTP
jgi:hypothetical protein